MFLEKNNRNAWTAECVVKTKVNQWFFFANGLPLGLWFLAPGRKKHRATKSTKNTKKKQKIKETKKKYKYRCITASVIKVWVLKKPDLPPGWPEIQKQNQTRKAFSLICFIWKDCVLDLAKATPLHGLLLAFFALLNPGVIKVWLLIFSKPRRASCA